MIDQNNVLEINDIHTTFRNGKKTISKAVDGVSISIRKGEIVGLVGESGSGKSVTTLSMLQLVMSPGKVESGEVYIEGNDENLLSYSQMSEEMRAVRGGKIGIIFQEPMTSLNPILSVGFQIQENIKQHLSLDDKAAKERAIDMMRQVGISDPEKRYDQYPQHFSGGMRQRIMIAMALSAEPEVLVADEATTALDVTTQAQILELLQNLAKTKDIAIIIITHNLGLVARYADRIYVMYGGKVVESSDKYELFANPVHPYTRGLLKAVPRLSDDKSRRLTPIEGNPPSPENRNEFCQFYERCPYHDESCLGTVWELKDIGNNHFVRCSKNKEELDSKDKSIQSEKNLSSIKKISDEICLSVRDLKMYFPLTSGLGKSKGGEIKAVDGVSFDLRKGETLGIVGESGCGKSTLARCIMRAYKPTSGSIVFEGTDIASLKERKLKPFRKKLSMIFQDPYSSLDPRQSAGSIVGEILKVNKLTSTKEEYNARIDELFALVGLDPSLKGRVPREFSGGQRQRLGIARALASEPDIIVCDEPISALDVSIQAQVINLLEDLQARLGVSYLFIAHDLSVVKHISDRIIVMYLGSVMEVADCDSLYEHPMHPYTKALLSAVPIADPKSDAQRERIHLKGEVPSVMNRPTGCPFSNRCSYATDKCRNSIPPLQENSDGHQVACFYPL